MIQEVNEAAGETLVEAAVGGKQGGGARLTPHGRLALEVYDKVRRSLVDSAADSLRQAILPDDRGSKCIHLAAAISMQEAVGQILAEYTLVQPTVQVRAIFGASNELVDHLLAGAPGDVFISAELAELDRLEVGQSFGRRFTPNHCQKWARDRGRSKGLAGEEAGRSAVVAIQASGFGGACLSARSVFENLSGAGWRLRKAAGEGDAR